MRKGSESRKRAESTVEECRKPMHANGLCASHNKQEWTRTHPTAYRLANYKRNARVRAYSWRLTDEDFAAIIQQDCYYCGEPGLNGVDRLDNSLGYFPANVVPCCTACNRAKSSLSADEFLALVSKVYMHSVTPSASLLVDKVSQETGTPKPVHR